MLVIPAYRHESLDHNAPSPEELSGLSTVDTDKEVVTRRREPPDPDELNAVSCPVCWDAPPADEEEVRVCEQGGQVYPE